MRSEKILPKIILLLGFVFLLSVIIFQAQIRSWWNFNLDKAKVHKANFFARVDPKVMKRQPPVLMSVEEVELKQVFGEPFISFSDEQWAQVWDAVFGIFPKENALDSNLPEQLRQLSIQEIADELTLRFPAPFANFNSEQWKVFFSLAIKNPGQPESSLPLPGEPQAPAPEFSEVEYE